MTIHKTHELYTSEDFTADEIAKGNVLAVKVIEGSVSVCKKCGDYKSALYSPCRASKPAHLPSNKLAMITQFKHLVYNMGRTKTRVLNDLVEEHKRLGRRETDVRAIFRTGTRWNY